MDRKSELFLKLEQELEDLHMQYHTGRNSLYETNDIVVRILWLRGIYSDIDNISETDYVMLYLAGHNSDISEIIGSRRSDQ